METSSWSSHDKPFAGIIRIESRKHARVEFRQIVYGGCHVEEEPDCDNGSVSEGQAIDAKRLSNEKDNQDGNANAYDCAGGEARVLGSYT